MIFRNWPILVLFLFAFYVRTLFIGEGAFLFSYDQARDAYTIKELLSGDIKIQGPPTSTRDFFHGVLYFYVLAPGYALGQGSPIAAATWLAAINSAGIFLLFFMGLKIFNNRFYAGLLALLYAVSYESTQYSFYLANTALAALTVPLLYYALYAWRSKISWGPLLSGLAAGLTFQANFLLLYHLGVILVALVLKLLPWSRKAILIFMGGFLITSSSMWLSELKFGLPSLDGPAGLLARSSYSALQITPSIIADTAVQQLTRLVGLNLWPVSTVIATVIFGLVVLLFSIIRPRPNWWWLYILGLVGFTPALVLGGISSPYIHAGLGSLVMIITIHISRKVSPLILVPIILVNLTHIISTNSSGRTEFAIQTTMTLTNELAAIDYIYSQAELQPFSISTVAAPLNINTTWSYLFNWYGQKTYGYLPYWHGPDQSGQPGDNLSRPGVTSRYFLIIEPSQGLPEDLINSKVAEENRLSNFNHKKQFGEITVHARTRK